MSDTYTPIGIGTEYNTDDSSDGYRSSSSGFDADLDLENEDKRTTARNKNRCCPVFVCEHFASVFVLWSVSVVVVICILMLIWAYPYVPKDSKPMHELYK